MTFLVRAAAASYPVGQVWDVSKLINYWACQWYGEPQQDLQKTNPVLFSLFSHQEGKILSDISDRWIIVEMPLDKLKPHYNDPSEDLVEHYGKLKEAGSDYPPVILEYKNGKWDTIDGAHRLTSAIAGKEKYIKAFIPASQKKFA